MGSGLLKSAQDFHQAAFIFQHGETPQDYLLAHILAVAALAKGDAPVRWWTAATLDRYLQSLGQPQVFGTQYMGEHPNQGAYDQELVPDALRKEFCVPSLAGQQQNIQAMQQGKDWPFPEGCR
jgi:hypothetical protein